MVGSIHLFNPIFLMKNKRRGLCNGAAWTAKPASTLSFMIRRPRHACPAGRGREGAPELYLGLFFLMKIW